MQVHLFGVRHHGPGSSRHVLDALRATRPDIILIEGPPEGESMLSWAQHPDMKAPVALLAYVADNPRQAVFYPFTHFSPEWNAIQYGLSEKLPVRFIDMPLTHKLARTAAEQQGPVASAQAGPEVAVRRNPIAWLADLAGFDDAEEWWEHQFELAKQPIEVFEAIALAMGGLREAFPGSDEEERIREAFMRKALRLAQTEKYERIAVICGAWHVPALTDLSDRKGDEALIRSLPKTKVECTWIPWTHERLSSESGYGAGVDSPGWYQHVWDHPEDDGTLWLSLSAHVFRKHRIDISSAHIIEALRLSHALAALRGLSRASLKEYNEATRTVMCMGDEILMQVIRKELIVGHRFGELPEGTPQVPLQRDFEKLCKSLRLKVSPEAKALTLDLRDNHDLQKSMLLHRLGVIEVAWGHIMHARSKGTFKEEWLIRWQPEMTIALLEKAAWGNSVEAAANRYLAHQAASCKTLAEISSLIQQALPAELPEGMQAAMQKMDVLSASTFDTQLLMDAFLPLVQISRYGNVRNTDTATVRLVLESVLYRMLSNLPGSCANIDEEQAAELAEKIRKVHQGITLLETESYRADWLQALQRITDMKQAAAHIHGTCCKIRYDLKELSEEVTADEFSKALSVSQDPHYSAHWLEGFLKDGATLLLFDDVIWGMVHGWINSLPEEVFLQIIPLLRRTFAPYTQGEKRKIAARVHQVPVSKEKTQQAGAFNPERAEKVLPILEKLMFHPIKQP
ncbi:MAG: hypothetical protein EAZ89_17100 [Bacteroidetes bacterium]|nr:MAG: hypothetical protein EAZ89_17100 [Bacteroidota bacterium]